MASLGSTAPVDRQAMAPLELSATVCKIYSTRLFATYVCSSVDPGCLVKLKYLLLGSRTYALSDEINNRKMNLGDQIKTIEGKVEAAYQTLLAIAEDREFKKIKM